MEETIKINYDYELKKIEKFITSSSDNSKEKYKDKPEYKWVLNKDIFSIAEPLSQKINEWSKKYSKINFIDLFSGGTLLSLNLLKNLNNVIKINFNDTAYKKEDILKGLMIDNINYTNIDINKIINYYDLKNKNEIELTEIETEELKNNVELYNTYNNLFINDKNTLNIIILNPLIGENGFKSLTNSKKDFVISKIQNTFPSNSLILFFNQSKLKIEEIYNDNSKIYIENVNISFTEIEKQQYKLQKIFNENFTIEEIKNNNKYNIYIEKCFDNENSIGNYFFNGKEILDEDHFNYLKNEKKQLLFKKYTIEELDKQLEKIAKEFIQGIL